MKKTDKLYQAETISVNHIDKGILLAPKFSKGAESALKACINLFNRCFNLHMEIIKPVEQPCSGTRLGLRTHLPRR
jgi:hypothetical protein